jgi:L-asparagine transporter-like permease
MALKGLFRKKTVQDILKQVEKNNTDGHNALGKHLTARDLTAFGIAAIVGAGIFSTIGKQVQMVVLLFSYFYLLQSHAVLQLLLMLNCLDGSCFSAYTYSYVAFGEIIAWIIGWALIMEYSVGNITAIS